MIWQIDNSKFYAPPRTYEGTQLIGMTAVKPAGQMAQCAVGISNPKLLHRRSVTGGTIGGTGPSAIYLMRQPMSSQRLEIMRCATHLACDFLKEVENGVSKLSDGFVNLSNPTFELRKRGSHSPGNPFLWRLSPFHTGLASLKPWPLGGQKIREISEFHKMLSHKVNPLCPCFTDCTVTLGASETENTFLRPLQQMQR